MLPLLPGVIRQKWKNQKKKKKKKRKNGHLLLASPWRVLYGSLCALSLCVMVSALRSFRFFALAIAEAKWFLCFIGNML